MITMEEYQLAPGFPLRFRTEEDAMLWLECCKTNTEFPQEKRVYPFIIREDESGSLVSVKNPEYDEAQFEQVFVNDVRRRGLFIPWTEEQKAERRKLFPAKEE